MIATAAEPEFEREVLSSEKPALALFYAQWCPFCRAYLPVFRGAESDGVKLVEVDISDESDPLWDVYGIEVVPTLILFHGGGVIGRADGRYLRGLEEADLERMIQIAMEKR